MSVQEQSTIKPAFAARPIELVGLCVAVAGLVWAFGLGATALELVLLPNAIVWPHLLRDGLALLPAVLVWLMWRFWMRKRGASAGDLAEPRWGNLLHAVFWGLIAGLGPMLLAWAILAGLGHIGPPVLLNANELQSRLIMLVPIGMAGACLHALAERLLIQKVVQSFGLIVAGPLWSVVAAGATFAGLQALQGYDGLWFIANSFAFGCVLALLALGRGGIMAAVLGHAVWTFVETIILAKLLDLSVDAGGFAGAGGDSYGSPVFFITLLLLLAVLLRPLWRDGFGKTSLPLQSKPQAE